MAEKTFIELTELPAGQLAAGDVLALVDVSDTAQSPQGTSKKITAASVFTNPNITGTLTSAGRITTDNVTDATTTTDGSIQTDGGISAVKAGFFGSLLTATYLKLTNAASKIVAGGTSFSVRNSADNADNLLVTDAGIVTARAGLVSTAGGVTTTKIISTGSTLGIAAGSDMGSGAIASVIGNDLAGKIQIITGTGSSSGQYAVLTFNTPYPVTPKDVQLTGETGGYGPIVFSVEFATLSTTGFSVYMDVVSPAVISDGSPYNVYYTVVQ